MGMMRLFHNQSLWYTVRKQADMTVKENHMALHLITGSAGAGKSYMVYQTVIAKSGRNPGRGLSDIGTGTVTMQTQKEVVDLHPGHAVRKH